MMACTGVIVARCNGRGIDGLACVRVWFPPGGGQYRDFSDGDADDDGVTYGARGSYADMADDTAGATPLPPSVDDAELRRLGGNAVFFVRRTC